MNTKLTFESLDRRCIIKYVPWHVGVHAALDIESPISANWSLRVNIEHWQEWLDGLRSISNVEWNDDRHHENFTRISTINNQVFIFNRDASGLTLEFSLSTEDARTLANELEILSLDPKRQKTERISSENYRMWIKERYKRLSPELSNNNSRGIIGFLKFIFGTNNDNSR